MKSILVLLFSVSLISGCGSKSPAQGKASGPIPTEAEYKDIQVAMHAYQKANEELAPKQRALGLAGKALAEKLEAIRIAHGLPEGYIYDFQTQIYGPRPQQQGQVFNPTPQQRVPIPTTGSNNSAPAKP